MKVYISAIEGLVPDEMVCTIRVFMDFTYIVRRDVHDENSL
jgi:hypothetical protein